MNVLKIEDCVTSSYARTEFTYNVSVASSAIILGVFLCTFFYNTYTLPGGLPLFSIDVYVCIMSSFDVRNYFMNVIKRHVSPSS